MPRNLKLNLRLTADAKGFVGEVRVGKKELDKLTGSTRKGTTANRTYTRTTRQTEAATRKLTGSTRKGADRNKTYTRTTRQTEAATRKLTGSARKGADRNKTYTHTTRQAEVATRKLAGSTRKGTTANRTYARTTRQAEVATRKLTGSTRKGTTANRTYTRTTRQTEVATRKAGKGFLAAHGQAVKYFGVIGGVTLAANAARGSVRLADTYTELNNRLRLVTDSERELISVREKLFDISQKTRSDLATNAALYSRVSLAVRSMARSSTEVLLATELLNKQIAIAGNTSQEATAGLIQLAQGLASGRFAGDELKSVLENVQGVSEGLLIGFAKLRREGQIDFDVTRKNIRDLAAEGVLSSELLLDAILASADDTNEKFKKVVITVSGGMIQISNATLIAIGEMDESIGSSTGVSAALSGIAASMEYLDEAIIVVAASLTGRYGTAAALAARKSFLAAREVQRLQFAQARLDGASRRAAIGMQIASRAAVGLRAGLALLGGPAGIALLVIYGIYEFATANDRASDSLSDLPGEVDAFRKSLEKLNVVQLAGRRVRVEDEFEEAEKELIAAQEKLEKITVGNTFNQVSTLANGGKFDKQAAADRKALAAEAVEDARELVALWKERLALLDTASTTPKPDADSGSDATPEPLDPKLDKILQSLHSRERVIRDKYAAQIAAVREGGKTLKQALAEEGKTKQGVIAELEARQGAEIATIREQQEQVAARVRQQAWKATGLAGVISRLGQEQAVTVKGVQARTAKELALVEQHSAKLAAQGINSADLTMKIEAASAAEITQIIAEATEERQQQEREAYDEKTRLREEQQTLELASLLGFHDEIAEAEYNQRGRLAELQSEQLAQAAGFNSAIEQQAAEHQKRLGAAEIAEKYRYTPKIRSIVQKTADFESATKEKSGRAQLQTGLALAQEAFANLATHSKKAFRLSQLAGIAQAVVATATGVANALSGPPLGPPFPLNYIAAAAVGAAGFAQIAAIRAQQPPQAFAKGGIVDSPTFFSARNVGRGVAGEAGTEAIMPVMRLPSGKLGVGYAGGGQQQHITFAPVVHVEVTGDGDDANATGGEIGRGVVTQLEPMFRGLLVNELRPGGLLNSAGRV